MTRPAPLAVALAAALSTSAALAADGDARELDRVTVSASTARVPDSESALPNTITVITREELDRQLAVTQDLSVVLANLVPAFAPARQKLTSFGESLRGRQPLYMVDGVPQSTPLRDGSRDAHTIDPALIERIEIIHGANALQGIGGSGGIVNFITKRAPDAGHWQEVRLGASNALPDEDDAFGWRAAYVVGAAGGAFDIVAGATYAREGLYYDADGRAIAVNGVQGDLMDAESNDLFAKFGWNVADGHRLQLTVNRYDLQGDGDYRSVAGDAQAGIPATSVPGAPLLDPPGNTVETVTLEYTAQQLAGGSFQAQLFWSDFDALFGESPWTNFFGDDPDSVFIEQSQNTSEKRGGKFTWSRADIANLPLRLTLGLDVIEDTTSQEMVESGLLWVPETTYRSISPLLQAEYWFGDAVMLVAGVRREDGELEVDDYRTLPVYGAQLVQGGNPELSDTLPNAGVVWHATDALTLYASYAEGYTVADVGRVLRAVNVPDQRVDDLVDLSPVVADNREIGVEYRDAMWDAHVAWYRSDSDLGSLLVYDPVADVYNVSRQATEIDGLEASAALRFGSASRMGVAYAQADGRYDRDQDGRLDTDLEGINIAPDRLTAFWEQGWTADLSTRLQASRAFDREFDRMGSEVADFDGYTTVDLLATYALPVGTLSAGIENLLDEQYIVYFSQTTPSDSDYTAGRGRLLTLTWTHRF